MNHPALNRQERYLLVAMCLALQGVIAWLDWVTGPLISFTIFYLAPIAMANRFAGERPAYVLAALAAAARSVASATGHPQEWTWLLAGFDLVVNLAIFFTFTFLLIRVRKLVSHLNQTSEALKQASEAIVMADTAHNIRFANDAFCKLFGYSRQDMVGRPLSMLGTADHPIKYEDFCGEVLRRSKDGRDVPIMLKVASVRDTIGNITGYVAVMMDLTAIKAAEQALRESEEKLRGLYELSPLGIALADMDGRYLDFNRAFSDICGYAPDELKSLSYWALTPKEYEADEATQIESLERCGRYGPYEKEYVRKDGTRVPLRLNGVLLTGRDGRKYIWSIVEDITDQRKAEQLLHDSHRLEQEQRESLEALVGSMPGAFFCFDPDGRIVRWNRNFAHTVGMTSEAISRSLALDFIQKEDRPVAQAAIERVLTVGSATTEARVLTARGPVPYAFWASRVDIGGVPHIIGAGFDITERKKSEERLLLANTVLSMSSEGIVVTDSGERVLAVNNAFTTITGYTEDEIKGMTLEALWSGRKDPEPYKEMWHRLASNDCWQGEIPGRRKDGRTYPARLSVSAVRNDNGQLTNYVFTVVAGGKPVSP
jgi:PAS domain S-box-containing protein